MLSTPPDRVDGRLEPRHVDLRAFVDQRRGERGGGCRRPHPRGARAPARWSSTARQNGGGKDTWVLAMTLDRTRR